MWQDFLREQAKNHDLSPEETDTLLKRFPDKDRYIKNEAQFTTIINEGISEQYQIGVDTITKRMQNIYKKFQADCPQLKQSSPGKLGILREWLISQFVGNDKTLTRCILGLKGNYQDAQDKLTEITQTLQNRLNDKTLSITKVEEGSIILIVESSQAGYEQLKTLIGQEIAGFRVEYAIDEWQDICRRMLLDRKPLTSNTVIGHVYGNRNLIDEDLFVDLALVKPKRSQNEKHPQDIDPAKGSDLFTRQEFEKRFAYEEFLDEVICHRTQKNIAIIGEPGAGKTTLLQKLAFWLLQETDDLVIWVSLAELGSQPLGEYLEEKWLKEALGLSREEIKADWEQKFKGGAVWLLLDGLDEMSQSDQQALKFRGWVMNAPMIVTCRLNLWQANPTQLQGFQTYLTQPFQDEQVQEFIRRWFLVQADAESLWSQLQAAGKERIKDLCRNPLRLTLLCATWKVEDALPETMAELYAGFVESMYAWKKKAFPVKKEEKKQLNAALGALAKASLEAETSRFRLTHRLVCEYLAEPDEDSLLDKALRLGWLNEVGVAAENRREKVYSFYHATFQEYFAALAVDDWDYFLPRNHVNFPVDGKRYRIFEKQWKHVILLWLGREDVKDEEKERFIEKLVNFDDRCGEWNFEQVDRGFYEYQAYFLAAAGMSEFKICSVADQIVSKMVKWGVDYFDDFKVKYNLTWGFHSSKEEIIEILKINREKIISKLIFLIKNNKEEIAIRRGASHILREIAVGNEKAIAELIHLLETPVDEDISGMAAKILGDIARGYKKAIATLIQLLNKTENKNTRIEIVNILMRIDIGDEQVITALIQFVQNNTYEEIPKNNIALYLREIAIGHPKWILAVIQRLQIITDDLSTTFYQWLILCLGEISEGDKNAILALINLLNQATDQDTIQQIVKSLGKIAGGDKNAILALINLLNQATDQDTIQQIIKSLGRIAGGDTEAILALIELINQVNSPDILEQIGKILGKIAGGNQEAISALINLLQNSPNKYFRLGGDSTLSLISSQELKFDLDKVTGDLTHLVKHSPNLLTRKLALRTLSKITEDHQNKLIKFDSSGIIESHKYNQEEISQLIYSIETYVDDKSIARSAAYELEKIAPQGHEEAIIALIYAI
jgi:HEAT repeat protein